MSTAEKVKHWLCCKLKSPPPKMLHLHTIQPEGERWIIMGDFNSHSPWWGYLNLDPKGDKVEDRSSRIKCYWSVAQTSHMPTTLEPGKQQSAQTLPLQEMMWPKWPNVMWNNSWEEVTINQYFLSSSRICNRLTENCAQDGTAKE